MNERRIRIALGLCLAAVIVGRGVRDMKKTHDVESDKRKAILNEMGLDVAAIHNATDIINARIENGEIRSMEELRDAVLNEVAFQKITIREEE